MPGRGSQLLGRIRQQRVLHRAGGTRGNRQDHARSRHLLFAFLAGQEGGEIDRFLGRVFGKRPAVQAAQSVGGLACAALDDREGEAADIFRGQPLAVTGVLALVRFRIVEAKNDRSLAVTKDAESLRPCRAEITRLEGFELAEFSQLLTGLDDCRVHEAFAFALAGCVKDGLAAISHHEIAPVEMNRPFLTTATGDRHDARILDLLDRGVEISPCLDVFSLHTRLGEQLLVIKEADEADAVGYGPDLAIKRQAVDCGSVIGLTQLAAIGIENLGQVLQRAGLGLLFENPATPAVEEIRYVVGLQQRRQFCLESLVFEELQLNIDIGVLGLILLGDLLPDGHGFGIQLHVHPFYDRRGRSARCTEHESNTCRCGKAYEPAAQACACVPNRHDGDPPWGYPHLFPDAD
ncbi:Hypothetical protein AT6N2_L0232 [Agrobacterium tumefaciens]|nr:Hypothetical protein AT6N2_L0232 [Agrobacterium tumefaciens]